MLPETAEKGKKVAVAPAAAGVPKNGRGRPKAVPGKRAQKRKKSYTIYIYKVCQLF